MTIIIMKSVLSNRDEQGRKRLGKALGRIIEEQWNHPRRTREWKPQPSIDPPAKASQIFDFNGLISNSGTSHDRLN